MRRVEPACARLKALSETAATPDASEPPHLVRRRRPRRCRGRQSRGVSARVDGALGDARPTLRGVSGNDRKTVPGKNVLDWN